MSDVRKTFALFLLIGILTMVGGAALGNEDLVDVGLLVSTFTFFPFLFSD